MKTRTNVLSSPARITLTLVAVGLIFSLWAAGCSRKTAPTEIPEPGPAAIVEAPPLPGPDGLALQRAQFLIDTYALKEANTILDRLIHETPTNAIAHAYRARAAYRSGQRTDGSCAPEAVADAERSLAVAEGLQPGLIDVMIVRSYLKFFAGDLQGAARVGLLAEREDPTNLRVALLLAQISLRAGVFDEAERRATAIVVRVREGIVLDRAYDILADIYIARKDSVRSAKLKEVLARHPGFDAYGHPR